MKQVTPTAKMSVDIFRLLAKYKMVEKDDPPEVQEYLQGVAGTYLGLKEQGETDLEFPEWYETADLSKLNVEEDEEEDPTPSAPKRTRSQSKTS